MSGVDPISDTLALRSGEGEKRGPFGSIRLWGSLGWALIAYIAGLMMEKFGIQDTQTVTLLALVTSTLRGVIQILVYLLSLFAFDRFGAYWLYVIGLAGCISGLIIFQILVMEKQKQLIIS